jgi:hypothetical protein
MTTALRPLAVAALLGLALAPTARAQVTQDVPAGRPDAIVDLATREGAALVNGTWRYRDAQLVEAANKAPGPDLRSAHQHFDVVVVVLYQRSWVNERQRCSRSW